MTVKSKMTLAAAARYTREAILAKPDQYWNQGQGHYPTTVVADKKKCGVCVGVMLADQLCPDQNPYSTSYFEHGFAAMSKLAGLDYEDLMLILEECGAGHGPDCYARMASDQSPGMGQLGAI